MPSHTTMHDMLECAQTEAGMKQQQHVEGITRGHFTG